MENRSAALVRNILSATSLQQQVALLVDAPHLDVQAFIAICQNGQPYGFSPYESAFLRSQLDHFSRILLALSGELHPGIPSTLYGMIGMAHRMRGNTERAKAYYLFAFQAAINDKEKAMALCSYAVVEMEQGSLEKAASTLTRALRICEGQGIRDATCYSILNNLGLVVSRQGDARQAARLFEESASLARADDNLQFVLQTRLNLAELYRNTHQFDLCRRLLDELEPQAPAVGEWAQLAISRLRAHLHEDELASGIPSSGKIASGSLGDLIRSAVQGGSGLQALRAQITASPQILEEIVAEALKLFSGLTRQNPEGCLRLALMLREAAQISGSAVEQAEITRYLCLHSEQATDQERILWLEDSLAALTDSKILNPALTAFWRAMISALLGDEYSQQSSSDRRGNLLRSIHFYKQSLAYLQGESSYSRQLQIPLDSKETKTEVARIYYNIGSSYNELFEIESDVAHNRQAIEHFRAGLSALPDAPESAPIRARIRANLSNALSAASQTARVTASETRRDRAQLLESLHTQAIALDDLRSEPADYARALINLSQTYLDLAEDTKYSDQSDYLSAACDCLEQAQEALKGDQSPDFTVLLSITEVRRILIAKPDAGQLRHAARLMERAFSLVDQTLLHERASAVFSLGCKVWDRLGERGRAYRCMLSGLAYLYRLQFSGQFPHSKSSTETLRSFFDMVIVQLLQWGEHQRAIFFLNQFIAIGWGASPASVHPDRVALPGRRPWRACQGQTIVQFWMNLQACAAWVIRPEGLTLHRYDFDMRQLVDLWLSWSEAQELYRQPAEGGSVAASEDQFKEILSRVGVDLGRLLFQPLQRLLPTDSGELVLIPMWLLQGLPLHLAHIEQAGQSVPLLDCCDLKYCELIEPRQKPENENIKTTWPVSFLSYSPPEAPLPFSHFEAIAVADTARAAPLNQKLGKRATADALVDSLRESAVVHLACHGEFLFNDSLKSSFLLADRPVTLRELQLRLHQSPCKMIVLSACESGRREMGASFESAGFSGALLNAGCQTVIGTQWRVKDISTGFLMRKFYAELSTGPHSPAGALCRAQRWLREQGSSDLILQGQNMLSHGRAALEDEQAEWITEQLTSLSSQETPPFEHPLYWGAFVVQEKAASLRAST